MDCHSLLQRIFPTQRLNPGLLHHRKILYHLSYREVLKAVLWVFNRHKDQGAEGKKYLQEMSSVSLKKKFKTRQVFKWSISRGKFNSHPLKESHEKMTTSLNTRLMQIKTTMRHFLMWLTKTVVQKLTNNKCWRKCGKKRTPHTVSEKVN